MVEGYQLEESATDAPVSFILTGGNWDEYCRPDDNGESGFSSVEQEALNRLYTGQSIADNPLAQDVLAQLGQFTLPLNAPASDQLREHTRERINNALGFIFTTPFVFAEGQK